MPFSFDCPHCGTEIEATDDLKGKTQPCPACHQEFTVPNVLLEPGQAFGGYRIERLLGVGNMGQVYLANQLSMDRLVALKLLAPELMRSSEDVERFLNEVRTLARIQHGNVVTAFEAGVANSLYFLAMSYVEGETLDKRLRRLGPLPEADVLKWCAKIGEVLKEFWEKHQILHRDIKPANIMIDKYGEVKLMDMGISKSLRDQGSLTMTGLVVGTPYYMSTEQARGDRTLDHRTDIYALGATIFHLVTGSEPYPGDNAVEVLTKHATDPTPSAHKRNDKVSVECSQLLKGMMAKDRDKRHATWDEVLADIQRVREAKAPLHTVEAEKEKEKEKDKKKGFVVAKEGAAGAPRRRTDVAPAHRVVPAKPKPSKLPFLVVIVILAGLAGFWYVKFVKGDTGVRPPTVGSAGVVPTTDAGKRAKAEAERRQREEAAARRAAQDQEKLARLEQSLKDANTFADQNPDNFEELLKRYGDLVASSAGSAVGTEATARLAEVEKRKDAAVTAALEGVKKQADALVQAGDYAGAKALYDGYTGAYADETAKRRKAAMAGIDQQAAQAAARVTAGQARLVVVLNEVAALMVKGELDKAKQRFGEAHNDPLLTPVTADLGAAEALLDRVARGSSIIAESFRNDLNKPVTLLVDKDKGGKVTFEPVEILGLQIRGNKVLTQDSTKGQARVPVTYHVRDLAPREKLVRLGEEKTPELNLLRGLVSIEGAQYEAADKYIRPTETPLTAALLRQLELLSPERLEGGAATMFAEIARLAKLSDKDDLPAAVQRIWQQVYEPADRAQLMPLVADFSARYPETKVGQEKLPLVEALSAALAVERKPADQPTVDAALKALRQATGLADLATDSALKDGGVVLKLDGNPGLTDLTPLAGLPVIELSLVGSGLTDLKSLRGMPLRSLALQNTAVVELGALRGMPLRNLNLAQTKVVQLAALTNLPLTTLNLAATPVMNLAPLSRLPLKELRLHDTEVTDVAPLAGLTSLQFLTIPRTVKDLEPLRKLPLKILSFTEADPTTAEALWKGFEDKEFAAKQKEIAAKIAAARTELTAQNPGLLNDQMKFYFRSKVEPGIVSVGLSGNRSLVRIAALKDLPLTDLSLSETQVFSLEPLKGMPLKSLDVSYTGVQDLSPLRGMPLESLSCYSNRVSDFSILKTLPLKRVSLGGRDLKDLKCIAGLALQSLGLHGTSVEKLAELRDMPLTSLTITDAPLDHVRDLKKLKLESLTLRYTKVKDLAPLEGMPLHSLDATGSPLKTIGELKDMPLTSLLLNNTGVNNLTPLKGLKLTHLELGESDVKSLSGLKGLPLDYLSIAGTKVYDLAPLEGLPLTYLNAAGTEIRDRDLKCLKEMPLTTLLLGNCARLNDLSALMDCPKLVYLTIPKEARKLDALRKHPTLGYIQYGYDWREGWVTTAGKFWADYDENGGK